MRFVIRNAPCPLPLVPLPYGEREYNTPSRNATAKVSAVRMSGKESRPNSSFHSHGWSAPEKKARSHSSIIIHHSSIINSQAVSKKLLLPLLILCGLAATAALAVHGFRNLPGVFVIDDPLPDSVDVLFKFDGEYNRDYHLLELANRYPNANVVASIANRSWLFYQIKNDGLDTARFTIVDTCTNTWSEVGFIKSIVDSLARMQGRVQNKEKIRVGLISSPLHMQRIHMMFSRKGTGRGIKFYYLPVPLCKYAQKGVVGYGKWWQSDYLFENMWIETGKICYFLVNR